MKLHLFVVFFVFIASLVHADTPLSKYGMIQNVQNYSSNPFWNPNGPYNQRMPTAVYAMGPDVGTDECQNIVLYLVSAECATRNKCVSTQLSDIKPSIILQLSQMSGGSYATACGGYIDSTFDAYVKQNAIAAPSAGAAFPTTTDMPSATTESTFEIKNPFSLKLQEWQKEILDRKQELKDLQAANGVSEPHVVRTTEFPPIYADLSFSERMENAKTGYEPYKDASAYKEIKVESEENYLKRQQELARAKDRMNLTMEEFCKKYPNEGMCREKTWVQARGGGVLGDARLESVRQDLNSGAVTLNDNELLVRPGEIVFRL